MAVGTGVKQHPPISETRGRARGQGAPKRYPRAMGQMENEPPASRFAAGARPQGVRFLTSDLYAHFTEFVADARESVHIIAPFIRVEALNVILRGVNLRDVTLVTTWSTKDILTGASDLDVYPYLRSRGWRLFLHPGLHAKLLVSDSDSAIVTSANITKPGLGLAERSNVECALEACHLQLEERLWLLNLVRASLLVEDEYFLAFRRHIDRQPKRGLEPELEEFDPAPYLKRQPFLLSSLPVSDTPEKLLSNIEKLKRNHETELTQTEVTRTLHDMALFSLSAGVSLDENRSLLRNNFFINPFISEFATTIAPHRFFGEAKEWVQNNCADTPMPRRRDLTARVRILFDWFVALGDGDYVVTRPNHSERLSNIRYR